jgi:hypothetical protein
MADENHIDPKGYWIDPDRNIRRMSGEQEVILSATEKCSAKEWERIREAIGLMQAISDIN